MLSRKLNQKGVREFESFIEGLRSGGRNSAPTDLLTESDTSTLIENPIAFDSDIEFDTRYDLGESLAEALSALEKTELHADNELWTSIALSVFDQLCPLNADGSRKKNPNQVYNYIRSDDYKHKPRHAIYTTWQLVDMYGEDARFLLSKGLSVRGELIEQLMARQYFFSCQGVMKAASKLYTDQANKTFKRGATTRNAKGTVDRYVQFLQQLEVNYDIYSIAEKALIESLPSEFDRFRENS